MMANDGQIAGDTLFGPERPSARAVAPKVRLWRNDWDQGDRGLSSGRAATVLQSSRRIHARNRNHASFNRNTLASREPSIHNPSMLPNADYKSRSQAIASIAEKFGCSRATLRDWVNRQDVEDGERNGLTESERDEFKALQRENRELRQANEVLRKGVAFVRASIEAPLMRWMAPVFGIAMCHVGCCEHGRQREPSTSSMAFACSVMTRFSALGAAEIVRAA